MNSIKRFGAVAVCTLLILPAFASAQNATFSATSTSARLSITGIDAPTSLSVAQNGTWTVHASSATTTDALTYSAVWGDGASTSAQSTSTLRHSFSQTGTFVPTFVVTDVTSGDVATTSVSVAISDDETTASPNALICPALTTTLSIGMVDAASNGQIAQLQQFLVDYFNLGDGTAAGYFGASNVGTFGPQTRTLVSRFQGQLGISQVGFVGPQTRAAITAACSTTPPPPPSGTMVSLIRQNILPSVVQIWCADIDGGPEAYGGSGIYLVDADGRNPRVQTNAHVVIGKDGKFHGCNVYFPRPTTGSFYDSAYAAKTATLYHNLVSQVNGRTVEGLDLALLTLTGPLANQSGVVAPWPPLQKGTLAAIGGLCPAQSTFEIGDPIYVLGYPAIGADSITLTQGIISGFLGDSNETLKVSATISPGNSGGLVLGTTNGCYVGVPTWGSPDVQSSTSLGLVMSGGFVNSFTSGLTGAHTYTPPAVSATSSSYLTRTYAFQQFTLAYPDQWTVSKTDPDASGIWQATFVSPTEGALDNFYEAAVVSVQSGSTQQDFSDSVAATKKLLAPIDPSATTAYVTIPGGQIKAYTATFIDATVPPTLAGSITTFLVNGTLYTISISADAKGLTIDQYKKIFENMLASIVLTTTVVDANSSTTIPADQSSSCVELTHNLFLDQTDATTGGDVTKLQNFLIAGGYMSGTATGFFGPLTLQAVQAWQSAKGIVSSGSPDTTGYGYVGPRTRAAMAQDCEGDSGAFTATPTSGPAPLSVRFDVFTPVTSSMSISIDFGDGTSAPLNPNTVVNCAPGSTSCPAAFELHTYTSAGTYTAKLLKQGTCTPVATCQIPAPEIIATVTVTVTGGSGGACVALTHNLFVDQTDSTTGGDVTKLQNFLASTGYLTAQARGYFGPATLQAVQAWQAAAPQNAKYTLPSSGTPDTTGYGYVGVRTRAAIKDETCGGTVTPQPLLPSMGAFSAAPTSGAAPLAVTFNVPYISGDSTLEFGDGATTTIASATCIGACPQRTVLHTYSTVGTYTAQLTQATSSVVCTGVSYDPNDPLSFIDLGMSGSCTNSPTVTVIGNVTITVNGVTVPDLTGHMVNISNPTKASFVNDLYACVLGRNPTNEEYLYSYGQETLKSFYEVYRSFFNSPEYLAKRTSDLTYVTQEYNCVLGRAPEAEGLANHFAAVQGGRSRDLDLWIFLAGIEFQPNGTGQKLHDATGYLLEMPTRPSN